MPKVSYVLADRIIQDPLETYFRQQYPSRPKGKVPLYDFG